MKGSSYIEDKKRYYQSEHFAVNFTGKWVIIELPRPNSELPFFVKNALSQNGRWAFTTTVLVSSAMLFDLREEAEQFLEEKQVKGYQVFCLNAKDLI
ncbi:hypothetical protein [Rufibacter tibetensis]|uniref:Uncharacterized protein n=1 Tax=Rufibacter tibetensis TaxID=512763 RepID=A0A0N7HX12_9BACT|nr:hypothetical protein [Rufibacter tibetensis]ALJ00761.1 hypothetical protein DC20_19450 [Rufibacter tibetensis]